MYTHRTWWLALAIGLIVACRPAEEDRQLIEAPIVLSETPFILTPTPPLRTPGYFTNLCLSIPDDYEPDTRTWKLRTGDGTPLTIKAILMTRDGALHMFDQMSFGLSSPRDYVCVSSSLDIDFDLVYKQVAIQSTLPLRVEEIRWRSLYNM